MTVNFIIRGRVDQGSGWYLAPNKGVTKEIDKAFRYQASQIEFDPGSKEWVTLTAEGRSSACERRQIEIAPESVKEMVGLAAEGEQLNALVTAGLAVVSFAPGNAPGNAPGTTTEDWLNSLLEEPVEAPKEPEYEETELESGQILRHHTWIKCQLPCPLHGASAHPLNRADRHYISGTKVMFRMCRHQVLHPDPDDIQVREVPHWSVHSCCKEKCCKG